jgi:hypothetical protein
MILAGTITLSCGQKDDHQIISERRIVPSFCEVELKADARLYLRQGDKNEVRIDASRRDAASVNTKVENNKLLIDMCRDVSGPVNIHVTMQELDLVELTGSGTVRSSGTFFSRELTLRLSGSGEINAGVCTSKLKAAVAGSGKIGVHGRSFEADFRVSGSGMVDAQGLEMMKSGCSIVGEGNCLLSDHILPASMDLQMLSKGKSEMCFIFGEG